MLGFRHELTGAEWPRLEAAPKPWCIPGTTNGRTMRCAVRRTTACRRRGIGARSRRFPRRGGTSLRRPAAGQRRARELHLQEQGGQAGRGDADKPSDPVGDFPALGVANSDLFFRFRLGGRGLRFDSGRNAALAGRFGSSASRCVWRQRFLSGRSVRMLADVAHQRGGALAGVDEFVEAATDFLRADQLDA